MSHGATCGESDCTGFTRFANNACHLCKIFSGGVFISRAAFTHDVSTNSTVWNVCSNINGIATLVNRLEVFRERFPLPTNSFMQCSARNVFDTFHQLHKPLFLSWSNWCKAHAAVANNHGGHAMTTGWLQQCVPTDLTVIVRMNVNEARCDEFAVCIDFFECFADDAIRNFHNDPARNGNVSNMRWCACAINNCAPANDDVKHVKPPSGD